MPRVITGVVAAAAIVTAVSLPTRAQQPQLAAAPAAPGQGRGQQAPQFLSPEVTADRRITFRLYAPQAESVRVSGSDIPGNSTAAAMTKGDNGVWEATLGPVPAGAYRYNFNVAGVATIDPRNPMTSESNANAWSLVVVPGSDAMDTKNVPHGSIAAVTYYSNSLGRFRRLHVYTPPGYELGRDRFPVFYLLHGAGDSDDSWTSVGRAGVIIDNLVAAGKAVPMVVVMPAGHTTRTAGGRGSNATDEFTRDFVGDIMPYIEKTYRVVADRQHRAIAGLSMGGNQSLNIAIGNLDKFSAVGVYSSGLLGAFPRAGARGAAAEPPPAPAGPSWEEQHLAELDNAAAKKGLKLLWFKTGADDGLMPTTKGTVDLFKKHGFSPVFAESPGGHTWLNWRDYLIEFVPQLFQAGDRRKSS